jgi:hypothetical protein
VLGERRKKEKKKKRKKQVAKYNVCAKSLKQHIFFENNYGDSIFLQESILNL